MLGKQAETLRLSGQRWDLAVHSGLRRHAGDCLPAAPRCYCKGRRALRELYGSVMFCDVLCVAGSSDPEQVARECRLFCVAATSCCRVRCPPLTTVGRCIDGVEWTCCGIVSVSGSIH